MRANREGAIDVVVAVATSGALVLAALMGSMPAGARLVLGLVLLLAGGASLLVVRRAPVPVLACTAASALAALALGVDAPALAVLVAMYGAFRAGRRVPAVVTAVVLLAAVPLVLVARGLTLDLALALARDVLPLAWLIAACAAGEALRQAERRAAEAERIREETARRRADAERVRIARELHDSLTHQISVIKVQADVAVHLARKQGVPVPEPLLAISQAAREAARELRTTLEALRPPHAADRGLADLPALVEEVRRAGLDVALDVAGAPARVPPEVDGAAYRIVQESLTNVLRHAEAEAASVRVEQRGASVVLRIEDDGTGSVAAQHAPGHGLLGMRERVHALDGRLRAAPRPDGGFCVLAEIPLEHRA